MKEITILSGKGGTGKTTISAALASLVKNSVFCDNDVDAADLHIILNPQIIKKETFKSGWILEINANCTNCGLCYQYCKFDAIKQNQGNYTIDSLNCEGCKLCQRVCKNNAIDSKINSNNFWFVSETRFGNMVHAKMGPGEENSGRLVSCIRQAAKEIAQKNNNDYVINDGPPGIGCTAISSITGTNHVLLIIEPSLSGLHDAKRLVELASNFSLVISAVINKYDINLDVTEKVIQFLKEKNIPLLGKIPFDIEVVKAMIEKKTIIEYNENSESSNIIKSIWDSLK